MLLWHVRWGPHLEGLRKVRDAGGTVPVLDEQPSVPPELAHLWQAFADLHRSRAMGFSSGPIPLTEIEAWLRLNGVGSMEETREYVDAVRALDDAYLDEINRKP